MAGKPRVLCHENEIYLSNGSEFVYVYDQEGKVLKVSSLAGQGASPHPTHAGRVLWGRGSLGIVSWDSVKVVGTSAPSPVAQSGAGVLPRVTPPADEFPEQPLTRLPAPSRGRGCCRLALATFGEGSAGFYSSSSKVTSLSFLTSKGLRYCLHRD